ncbi:aminoacyl-tRNA hydrolase [Thioalkalivibrio sp. XN8]|uniref:aminoacyl-tRNA hydrolase n=1 Tax=Thioalkalivibrio sp. XN8 TaxID=2712863 RepID=UPI0013ED291D|nr:aminoacyl-tRNA hydrolase [Thioalkalivibrio sp. XN8]NGP54174.1 aminoacyl-tRNA hydrolase [Thioalkalivibrio sp. XN8]
MSTRAPIRMIVGLGNPGPDYADTRHNAGFWLVDLLAQRHGGNFRAERKFAAEVAACRVGGADVLLLKPQTFMNRSGQAVQAASAYLKIPVEQVLVAHDDLDLPPGTARLKLGGGHGGHNGLRDLVAHLGPGFWRLRLGIGHPGDRAEVIDYVLRRPAREEEASIREAVTEAADVIPILLGRGEQPAMHRLHTRAPRAEPQPGPEAPE